MDSARAAHPRPSLHCAGENPLPGDRPPQTGLYLPEQPAEAHALTSEVYQPHEIAHALALGDAKRWGARLDHSTPGQPTPASRLTNTCVTSNALGHSDRWAHLAAVSSRQQQTQSLLRR